MSEIDTSSDEEKSRIMLNGKGNDIKHFIIDRHFKELHNDILHSL